MKTQPRCLTVLVADDAVVIRDRLVTMLGELPGVAIIGQTGSGAETLASIRALKPDMVMLDLNLPGGSGLDVLRQMAAEQLQATVIVLTHFASPEYECAALAAGAHAFFSKSQQFTQAIEMIRQLADRADQTSSQS